MITGYDIKNVMNRTYGWPADVVDDQDLLTRPSLGGIRRLMGRLLGRRGA